MTAAEQGEGPGVERSRDHSEKALLETLEEAEALAAAGSLREARACLEGALESLDERGPEALARLSSAWEQAGDRPRAAELAAAAAEGEREQGNLARALELCQRARWLDGGTPGLHRTWGLALLAHGDPDGALGHLARWQREQAGDPEAVAWHVQALFESDQAVEARASICALAARAAGVGEAWPGDRAAPRRRRHDRAPGYFAIELEAAGAVTSEYATNLSCGGVSILSSRPLATETAVRIRFPLLSAGAQWIDLAGTVLRCERLQRSGDRLHRLAIAFEELTPAFHRLVDAEVKRLLSIPQW